MDNQKPQWFIEHEDSDERSFGAILDKLEAIEKKIDPVVDAYRAAGLSAKVVKWILGTSMIIVSIWALFTNVKSGGTIKLF